MRMQEGELNEGDKQFDSEGYPLYQIRGCWSPWECEWPYCHCRVKYDRVGRPKRALSSWSIWHWLIVLAISLSVWAAIIYAIWHLFEWVLG